LTTLRPDLCKEWNYEKNTLSPTECTQFTHKKVWWICDKNHEWQAYIAARSSGQGCPYCAGQKIWIGFNDLTSTHPDISREWNFKKNGTLKPTEVSKGTTKKVWWICDKGHEWQASPNARTHGENTTGCPICSNKQILVGYNDLETTHPRLCQEWDFAKNTSLTPKDVSKGSEKLVWWKCEQGHSWSAYIYERTAGRGCPQCQKELHSSFPEKCIFYYVSKYFSSVLQNYKPNCLGNLEFDIFIPSLNIAIEYDGANWHKQLSHDIKKNLLCEKNNIKLFRIREFGCPIDPNDYEYVTYLNLSDFKNDLSLAIGHLLSLLGVSRYNIDLNRDNIQIMTLLVSTFKEHSIIDNDELLKSWNHIKNGDLKPEHIKLGSNKKIWWVCERGHEWPATPYSRVAGNGCPYCSGRYVIEGETDLKTLNPNLAKEWNYEKNGDLKPEHFTANSNKRAWWKCNKGHEWQAVIGGRNSGYGCPFCAGQKVLKGHNDLQTVNPTLASEWNYEKNNELTPAEVMPNSKKKIWWKCQKGHEWEATIDSRNRGAGCPYCSGRYAIKGENDLQTVNPTLAKEWNYEKNDELTPMDVKPNSNKKVWWKCNKGHEWQEVIAQRNNGNNCPICRKNKGDNLEQRLEIERS